VNDADPLAAGLATREPGFTLVTATQRLSTRLVAAWDRREAARGREAWCAPDILPWGAWLQRAYAMLDDGALGLSPGQERVIWEDIIGSSEAGNALLHGPSMAAIAQSAWALMQGWSLDTSRLQGDASEDVRVFLQWAREFARKTADAGWVDEARMLPAVASAVRARQLSVPRRVLLGGFDELSPAQLALRDDLARAGTRVRAWWPAARTKRVVRDGFGTSAEEFASAAIWARASLEQNPRARLAIVVPELAEQRALIERVLIEVLDPPALMPGHVAHQPPFNFSLGRPLAEHAVIDCALGLLALARGPVSVDEAGLLLRSPYLAGGISEWAARAALDARLRARGEPLVSAGELQRAADREDCPELARRLQALVAVVPAWQTGRRQAAARWAADAAGVLNAIGWPGERALDSAEYQAQEAWRALLGRLAQLDAVTGPFDAGRAFALLHRDASETIFQARSGDAPVQVLGLIEATGLAFDGIWVTGLDADRWPRAPQPNPLLPLGQQRRLGMPRASSERELAYARLVTRRLVRSATDVVLSYPLTHDDRDLRPSPLVTKVPCRDSRETQFTGWRERIAARPVVALEETDLAPPFDPRNPVRGGSAVLTHQSDCPFRAFAVHRLGAAPLEEARLGLDAAERGTLVHSVLENFWRDVRSQAILASLSEEQREARMLAAIDAALDKAARRRPGTFTPAFTHLERARLARLMRAWLAVELDRQSFEVVEPEKSRKVVVEGLEMELRIDRIDQLAGAGRMIIDYKTGAAKTEDWAGARPRQPQLLLYSVYGGGEAPPSAVAFGCVSLRGCGYAGLADRDGLAPGVKIVDQNGDPGVAWAQRLDEWRETVARLAREFLAGHAVVDPRDEDSCRYCALPPLCRIRELNARLGRLAEAASDDS